MSPKRTEQQGDFRRLADAVSAARAEKGWTQAKLAEVADVDEGTINNLEGQWDFKRMPRTIAKVERALGWEPGYARRIVYERAPINLGSAVVRSDDPAGDVITDQLSRHTAALGRAQRAAETARSSLEHERARSQAADTALRRVEDALEAVLEELSPEDRKRVRSAMRDLETAAEAAWRAQQGARDAEVALNVAIRQVSDEHARLDYLAAQGAATQQYDRMPGQPTARRSSGDRLDEEGS